MNQPRLWLVRHGSTEWSLSGRHTGRTDLPLLPAGVAGAQDAGKALAGNDFGLVLTSPLLRARETCRLAGFGSMAQVDDDLAEWNYGDVEGLTTDAMREIHPGWTIWRDGCPGGETVEEVGDRADRVIDRALASTADVLAFAHGHILRVLAARWIGLPAKDAERLLLSTAAICVLGWERETRAIQNWNDTSHLSGT